MSEAVTMAFHRLDRMGHGTMTDAITLQLAMVPDRRLAPNASKGKSGWTVGPMIEAMRKQAMEFARDQTVWYETIHESVEVAITIYWGKSLHVGKKRARVEQDRPLDWDSATTICKPICDGALVDTGLIADDRLIACGTVRQRIDPGERGYMEITITAAAGREVEAA